MHNITKWEFQP